MDWLAQEVIKLCQSKLEKSSLTEQGTSPAPTKSASDRLSNGQEPVVEDDRTIVRPETEAKPKPKSTFLYEQGSDVLRAHEAAVQRLLAKEGRVAARLRALGNTPLRKEYEFRYFPHDEALCRQVEWEMKNWFRSCPGEIAEAIQLKRLNSPSAPTSVQRGASSPSFTVLQRTDGRVDWPSRSIKQIIRILGPYYQRHKEIDNYLVLFGGMWERAFYGHQFGFHVEVRQYTLMIELPPDIIQALGHITLAVTKKNMLAPEDALKRPGPHPVPRPTTFKSKMASRRRFQLGAEI